MSNKQIWFKFLDIRIRWIKFIVIFLHSFFFWNDKVLKIKWMKITHFSATLACRKSASGSYSLQQHTLITFWLIAPVAQLSRAEVKLCVIKNWLVLDSLTQKLVDTKYYGMKFVAPKCWWVSEYQIFKLSSTCRFLTIFGVIFEEREKKIHCLTCEVYLLYLSFKEQNKKYYEHTQPNKKWLRFFLFLKKLKFGWLSLIV